MLKKKEKEEKLYYQFRLDEFIPQDHFLRKVDSLIDFSFVREKVRHLYSRTGQPAIDPVVLIKMLLIGYFYYIKSERQIEKEIQVNLAYRWFIRYDLDERIPDHSVISQTRRRKFSEGGVFQEIFDEIVRRLQREGFLRGETILTDSTHIKANASMKSLTLTKEYFEELENAVEEEPRKISNETHISKTDPDSKLMNRPGKPKGLHYLEHRSIDESGYITDVYVTPGNASDHVGYVERLKRQEETFGFCIKNCVGDKGYGYFEVYHDLTEMGIDAYIPLKDNISVSKYEYQKECFQYDKEKDIYICPEGETLHKRKKLDMDKSAYVYANRLVICRQCPSLEKCGYAPKTIGRHIYEDDVIFQLEKENSEEWKRLSKLRHTLLEGSFGDAKNNHGLSRARMRGREKVTEQSLMTAVVQNIKKMVKALTIKKQAPLQAPAFVSYFVKLFRFLRPRLYSFSF